MDKLKAIYKDRLSLNSIDSKDCVLDAMRLAYNQAIQDAVDNVTLLEEGIDTESQRYTIQSDSNYYSEVEIDVNKDSILKLKIK